MSNGPLWFGLLLVCLYVWWFAWVLHSVSATKTQINELHSVCHTYLHIFTFKYRTEDIFPLPIPFFGIIHAEYNIWCKLFFNSRNWLDKYYFYFFINTLPIISTLSTPFPIIYLLPKPIHQQIFSTNHRPSKIVIATDREHAGQKAFVRASCQSLSSVVSSSQLNKSRVKYFGAPLPARYSLLVSTTPQATTPLRNTDDIGVENEEEEDQSCHPSPYSGHWLSLGHPPHPTLWPCPWDFRSPVQPSISAYRWTSTGVRHELEIFIFISLLLLLSWLAPDYNHLLFIAKVVAGKNLFRPHYPLWLARKSIMSPNCFDVRQQTATTWDNCCVNLGLNVHSISLPPSLAGWLLDLICLLCLSNRNGGALLPSCNLFREPMRRLTLCVIV